MRDVSVIASNQMDGTAAALRRRAAEEPNAPVLIVLHQQHSSPGHIGRLLQMRGYRLDIRRPRFGDPLPETLVGHAGAVIFGGPMSANDADEFIRQETDWIGVPLRENKPFLGVCLGAQMLARHLGARVFLDPETVVEIGYHAIRPTPAGERLGRWPERVYQWHLEGFDLPRDACLLASADGPFANQAFVYGPALGVQFHPEITYAQVHRWTGYNAHRLVLKGAQARHDQVAGHFAHGPVVQGWLDCLLGRWLTGNLRAV